MMPTKILLGMIMLGIALVATVALIALLFRPFARRLPRSPIARYEPPAGSLVAHGLLLRADRRVLAAAVLDLAVRGSVRVLAPRGRRGPVALEAPPGARLTADEVRLLAALRPPLTTERRRRRYLRALAEIGVSAANADSAPDVVFLTGRGAFARARRGTLRAFFDAERRRLKDAGIARPVTMSLHLYLLSLVFLCGVAGGFLLALGAILRGEWVGAIVTAATVAGLFWALTLAPPPMLRFTPAGQELRRHLSGLRDYMRLAEADRMRALQSPDGALLLPAGGPTPGEAALGIAAAPAPGDAVARAGVDRFLLHERLLPYAVLFGIERRWQREFDTVARVDVDAQRLRALGDTLDGVMATVDALAAAFQILRGIGAILSLVGRAAD